MSHVLHDLHAEFPQDSAVLHDLKLSDAHFQRLTDRYGEINQEIHRIEAEVEASSDARLEHLKKQRLGLLDEVSGIIAKARG